MKYSVEKSEHYILVRAAEGSTPSEIIACANEVLTDTGYVYVLLDLNQVPAGGLSDHSLFHQLNEQMIAKNGLLICFHTDTDIMHHFQDEDLIMLPSEHEAIEYVFMDQIEKQFLSEEE